MTVDGLTDVMGLRVGHATRIGDGWLTGTTVVLAPEAGRSRRDVRGRRAGHEGDRRARSPQPGAEGRSGRADRRQRLRTRLGVGRDGLAGGARAWCAGRARTDACGAGRARRLRLRPGTRRRLRGPAGRGRRPGRRGGGRLERAGRAGAGGLCGAGTGATIGPVKGGVGTASTVLDSGVTVGALVVCNAVGSAFDPGTGALYGELFQGGAERPAPDVHDAARRRLAGLAAHRPQPPLNTTVAVVATDAELNKAQAQKLAGVAHDGIARAVRPAHLLTDGDTVFGLATGTRPLDSTSPLALNEVLAAGADLVRARSYGRCAPPSRWTQRAEPGPRTRSCTAPGSRRGRRLSRFCHAMA